MGPQASSFRPFFQNRSLRQAILNLDGFQIVVTELSEKGNANWTIWLTEGPANPRTISLSQVYPPIEFEEVKSHALIELLNLFAHWEQAIEKNEWKKIEPSDAYPNLINFMLTSNLIEIDVW